MNNELNIAVQRRGAAFRETERHAEGDVQGLVFDIDTFAVHDGPGVRMAVYLKGCPLACRWCHSPESQSAHPEVAFVRDRCTLCGRCAAVCPQAVHRVDGGDQPDRRHTMDRQRCLVCGACVEQCPSRALTIKGYRVPASRVVARAVRMKPFFDHSGGGITLTGGEVTGQVAFAEAVLAGCRSQGIHTAIETCGACDWPRLERLVSTGLQHTSLVLYDLKLIDADLHRRWTGAGNCQILANARRLAAWAAAGGDVQIRVPLIPGITDTDENLRGIFRFMGDAGLTRLALLPYNPAAGAKYEWLGLHCEVQGEPQSEGELARFVDMAQAMGLEAVVD